MKEDIAKMAREAGVLTGYDSDLFKRLAAIVAARCAEIADQAEPYQAADLIRKAFGVDK